MVLHDSFSRQKVELPDPPGPIRMYVCGPTVYQRIHIGNARPFVVSMWMRQWLSERGYVEGRNFVSLVRCPARVEDAAPSARDLASLKPDVIVTWSNELTDAARSSTGIARRRVMSVPRQTRPIPPPPSFSVTR